MPSQFLEFDFAEDGDGGLSASALASPAPPHTPTLIAEVQALLQALTAELGPPGPLDEGHGWDLELQIEGEGGEPIAWEATAAAALPGRIQLSLDLAGGEALRQALHGWWAA